VFSRREWLQLSLATAGAALLTSAASCATALEQTPTTGSAAPSASGASDAVAKAASATSDGAGTLVLSGDFLPVHDPCIIKAGDTYHLFCTGHQSAKPSLIPWRTSTDLVNWTSHGAVFDAIPEWAAQAVPGTRGLWAPDISLYEGRYRLYYAVSTFGSNHSVIGLVTSATLDTSAKDFGWRDEGLVIRSDRPDDFNAIDANHFVDRDGKHWLCFGSFWGGIKLVPLDAATGKPAPGDKRIYSLASRPVPKGAPAALEAPFLIERNGFYYLFVAFDYCCRGVASSYYVVVGRARNILGPYVGPDGKSMMDGYGALVVQGNRRYRGPGHPAVLRDPKRDYLVYHAYDTEQEGKPALRISPIVWTGDGWPTVSL